MREAWGGLSQRPGSQALADTQACTKRIAASAVLFTDSDVEGIAMTYCTIVEFEWKDPSERSALQGLVSGGGGRNA